MKSERVVSARFGLGGLAHVTPFPSSEIRSSRVDNAEVDMLSTTVDIEETE